MEAQKKKQTKPRQCQMIAAAAGAARYIPHSSPSHSLRSSRLYMINLPHEDNARNALYHHARCTVQSVLNIYALPDVKHTRLATFL